MNLFFLLLLGSSSFLHPRGPGCAVPGAHAPSASSATALLDRGPFFVPDDPVIGEARLVPGDELGACKGQDFRVVVDQADRRDFRMPEQFADEQAIAAAKHEQVKRPCEPRPRREQGGMGEPIVVNRLVGGVELKVAAEVEPEPSRASLQDQRSVQGHLSPPPVLVPIKPNPMTVRCKNSICV